MLRICFRAGSKLERLFLYCINRVSLGLCKQKGGKIPYWRDGVTAYRRDGVPAYRRVGRYAKQMPPWVQTTISGWATPPVKSHPRTPQKLTDQSTPLAPNP